MKLSPLLLPHHTNEAATPESEVSWSENPNNFCISFSDGVTYMVENGFAKMFGAGIDSEASVDGFVIMKATANLLQHKHIVEKLARWIELADIQLSTERARQKTERARQKLEKAGVDPRTTSTGTTSTATVTATP